MNSDQGDSDTKHGLTHLGADASPCMVDVSAKGTVRRRAVAKGRMRLGAAAREAVTKGVGPKGSVICVATVAAISAAKRTPELIPLCHQIPLEKVDVDFEVDDKNSEITCTAEAVTTAKTGVEMEALVAVHVGLATVYDMCKAVDLDMEVTSLRLESKVKEKLA